MDAAAVEEVLRGIAIKTEFVGIGKDRFVAVGRRPMSVIRSPAAILRPPISTGMVVTLRLEMSGACIRRSTRRA